MSIRGERLARAVTPAIIGALVMAAISWRLHERSYLYSGLVVSFLNAVYRYFECRISGHYTPALQEVLDDLARTSMRLPPNTVAKAKNLQIRCARCYEWVDFTRQADAAVLGVKVE